jgi:hypothetical protein
MQIFFIFLIKSNKNLLTIIYRIGYLNFKIIVAEVTDIGYSCYP